ncbi:hypothetical protein Hanom_Chr10g00910281 [Helianthus anomalus]
MDSTPRNCCYICRTRASPPSALVEPYTGNVKRGREGGLRILIGLRNKGHTSSYHGFYFLELKLRSFEFTIRLQRSNLS